MLPRIRENTRVSVKRNRATIVNRTSTPCSEYLRCEDYASLKETVEEKLTGFERKISRKCFEAFENEESG